MRFILSICALLQACQAGEACEVPFACQAAGGGSADVHLLQLQVDPVSKPGSQALLQASQPLVEDFAPSEALSYLMVSDSGNHRVLACPLTLDGSAPADDECILMAGTGSQGSGPMELGLPSTVSPDMYGDMVIADASNGRVQVCPTGHAGNCTTFLSGLSQPSDAIVTEFGDYIITDTLKHRVLRCSFSGSCNTVAGQAGKPGSGPDQLAAPRSAIPSKPGGGQIWAQHDDGFLVVDTMNHRIQKCADAHGLVCQTVAGTGSSGSGAKELSEPWGIVVDDLGNYVIADTGNHRVQNCPAGPPAQACTTVAGTSGVPGSDGIALSQPMAVEVDRQDVGIYFVADTGNHRVQRCAWPPSAPCTTVAGNATSGSSLSHLKSPRGVSYVSPRLLSSAATTTTEAPTLPEETRAEETRATTGYRAVWVVGPVLVFVGILLTSMLTLTGR